MKMWYFYRMEYYILEKNNDILKFVSKWMDQANILSVVTYTKKNKDKMYSQVAFRHKEKSALMFFSQTRKKKEKRP